jgi:hypothetical protein
MPHVESVCVTTCTTTQSACITTQSACLPCGNSATTSQEAQLQVHTVHTLVHQHLQRILQLLLHLPLSPNPIPTQHLQRSLSLVPRGPENPLMQLDGETAAVYALTGPAIKHTHTALGQAMHAALLQRDMLGVLDSWRLTTVTTCSQRMPRCCKVHMQPVATTRQGNHHEGT